MTQLIKKIIYEGEITLLTGTHIGGSNSAMSIGGPDSTIVRNPLSNQPYIPGSSIKGKMRSLFELQEGTIGETTMNNVKYGPTQDLKDLAARLFGTANPTNDNQQPSRLIVRDAPLLSKDEIFSNTDLPYTESKTEVVIDRITSAAMPRQIERVPAGAKFSFNMVLNIFDTDDESELIEATKRSIKLLEDDYIGGSGSRGYGQIKIKIDKTEERTKDFYINEAKIN
jgi:CRISPR-associated protein Csm3